MVATIGAMARRTLIWHLGLADAPRAVVGANLQAHAATLEGLGRPVVATAEEARLATHDLLRTHADAGLARSAVDGWWARVCDRVWAHKGVSLLSTPDLCVADKDQVRLALDPLIGMEVHLVVTADSVSQQLYGGWLAELRRGRTTGWDTYVGRVLADRPEHRQAEQFQSGHDLAALLARWGWTFHADRLHVLAQREPEAQWRGLLDVAGLGDAEADRMPALVPAYADPAGVAVLRRVNRHLDQPLPAGSSDLLARDDREPDAMPVVDTSRLAPLVGRWSAAFADAGHDVRGDLASLLDVGGATTLPGPRDQLGVAVDALADALAENAHLRERVGRVEAERDALDRKRRKWKRRAQQD